MHYNAADWARAKQEITMPDKDKLDLDVLKKAQTELVKIRRWAAGRHKDAFHKAHSWLLIQDDCNETAAKLALIAEFVAKESEQGE